MKYIADLHIHSKYSRAVSKQMDLEHLDEWSEIKGIDLMVTADFTHPAWFKELASKLIKQENGFYNLKGSQTKTQFLLGTELACIYKKNGKCRRIHLVVVCSDLKYVKKVNEYLEKKGFNLKSDGRPILGIDVKDLCEIYLNIDPQVILIPAHIWTPWFSLFGSKSGYDSWKECFEDISDEVPAIETGLSSDPEMNWRISDLNNKMILSNSDAHSLDKLGREANVFDLKEGTYDEFYSSIKQNKNLLYTIEFYPEEGKYHYDGHAKCNFSCSPKETIKHKGVCPKCGKNLTIGVDYRVEELADQEPDPKNRVPFKSLVPLKEIIAEINGVKSISSKKVGREYDGLIEKLGSEFHILLEEDLEKIKEFNYMLSIAIDKMRRGDIVVDPGYDGVFGTVKIFSDEERAEHEPKQKSLF